MFVTQVEVMLESIPENEVPFLPKENETLQEACHGNQGGRMTRLLLIGVALASALVSVVRTVIMHNILPTSPSASRTSLPIPQLLPSLNLPPLGSVLRTYIGEPAYYAKDLNTSREA
ncbi:hypothetical protein K449DRAFT_436193 [Hypoxylon sp. EC38]|nr:hypothetical protein K449DRAFT_436193 [Hypoxylon sp. EC38]